MKTQMPFDPAEAGLEEGYAPQLAPITADEPASEDEERTLGLATINVMEYLYSDEGMMNVLNVLKKDDRPLYEKIPDIAMPLLEKAHAESPDADAATFFGEGGLIQQVASMLLELAEQEGVPGADDEEQQQATIINLYRKAGEYVQQSGDQDAIQQGQELGIDMALTQDDGTMMAMDDFKEPQQTPVAAGVQQGLLGL